MKKTKKRIAVIGAGPIGRESAWGCIGLAKYKKFDIALTMIAAHLPGEGGSAADGAAGYGGEFYLRDRLKARFVRQSYLYSLKLARRSDLPWIQEAICHSVKTGHEKRYCKYVQNYQDHGSYVTYAGYSFCPVSWGKASIECLKERGMTLEQRFLSVEEMALLHQGISLPGFDYTIVATGLGLQNFAKPVYPVGGILVHFPEGTLPQGKNYMDEMNVIYGIPRYGATVIGGSCDQGVAKLPDEPLLSLGQQVVERFNKKFGQQLDPNQHTRITYFGRPAVLEGQPPILQFGAQVAFVGGFGSLGFVPGYGLRLYVRAAMKNRLLWQALPNWRASAYLYLANRWPH